MGREIPELDSLRGPIEKAIDGETSTVKDNASPQLRSLRARIFKLRNRLRSILESYFRQKDSRKILQDQIITERNGRSVLPVRSECRGELVGIVHGTSSSGATLFIEPLSTVEINNDIVSVEEQERQEVERILRALTDEARSHKSELAKAVEQLGHLDLMLAKASLSEAYGGSEPHINEENDLEILSGRHPLLVGKVAERCSLPQPEPEAVPISFRVHGDKNALVITGPNTGGKTVALKCAGLLSLMAQSGLHVPADSNSTFPVFRQIFADIGDEQSIGSSLSTFSAHLKNIVEMDENMEKPALVLLDEVGSGTDPAEGGALGTALVEHFRSRGALVLASTHHGMLKTYATTTSGVGSASFQFDPETYEPIYQLVEGSTGRSLAFEMAIRLGLSEKVVDKARELQSKKERQVEDMIHRLEADGKKLSEERDALDREHQALSEELRRQRDKAREAARTRDEQLESLKNQLQAEAESARSELRNILEEVKFRSAQEVVETRPPLSQIEREAVQRIETLEAQLAPVDKEDDRPLLDVCAGDQVTISSLGLTGVVVETIGNGEVEVMVRDKKLRIGAGDLEAARSPIVEAPSSHTSVPERKQVPQELNVIGCTVDEALSQADKFLDDAFLSDHRTVRLIHGLGKGRLKKAIRNWLETHPHVIRHQSEGSGAVTVVELKE
jgi:DNA mismatch repair protein MutS2